MRLYVSLHRMCIKLQNAGPFKKKRSYVKYRKRSNQRKWFSHGRYGEQANISRSSGPKQRQKVL